MKLSSQDSPLPLTCCVSLDKWFSLCGSVCSCVLCLPRGAAARGEGHETVTVCDTHQAAFIWIEVEREGWWWKHRSIITNVVYCFKVGDKGKRNNQNSECLSAPPCLNFQSLVLFSVPHPLFHKGERCVSLNDWSEVGRRKHGCH